MDKELYLNKKFFEILQKYPELDSLLVSCKDFYLKDKRDLDTIKREIGIMIEKYDAMGTIINKDIDENIANNSIILIGPMGVGKTTISKQLAKKTGFKIISLDDRESLYKYYSKEWKFKNFKEFELYLTAMVLNDLNEPSIIDFGAGHSIQENPLMFLELKKLVNKFSNVVLLMPCENKNRALYVLNKRIEKRSGSGMMQALFDRNEHFIESPCNYELSTIIKYEDDKDTNQISDEILREINEKTRRNNL